MRLYGWMHKRSTIYYGRKDMGWIQFKTGMKESRNESFSQLNEYEYEFENELPNPTHQLV